MARSLLFLDRLSSPLGPLLMAHAGGLLCALAFQEHESRLRQYLAFRFGQMPDTQRRMPACMRQAMLDYLTGDLGALTAIPVHASGSRLQQRVWQALRDIPVGQCWSVAQLVQSVGQEVTEAAVAVAASRNPVALVVPCHRLQQETGNYAWGTARQRWLLAHEGALSPSDWRHAPAAQISAGVCMRSPSCG